MKDAFSAWIARLKALLRRIGPYPAIALLLPGGSVIALIVWSYRHRQDFGPALTGAAPRDAQRKFP
jgi:hypothetical protein